jgi:hypothetical protein
MQYPRIEWEDFRDGSGARVEFCIRMLIGDAFGCDECYNKRSFTVAVGKKNRGKYFHVYIDSTLYAKTHIDRLGAAKMHALDCLAQYIGETWLHSLLVGAEQTSNESALL